MLIPRKNCTSVFTWIGGLQWREQAEENNYYFISEIDFIFLMSSHLEYRKLVANKKGSVKFQKHVADQELKESSPSLSHGWQSPQWRCRGWRGRRMGGCSRDRWGALVEPFPRPHWVQPGSNISFRRVYHSPLAPVSSFNDNMGQL